MARSEYLLEIKNIRKTYARQEVLGGISLSIESGEIVGLLGPNGAGKTTLIKTIVGLVKPTGGTIKICGRSDDTLDNQTRSKIGYVAEEPVLYDFLTADQTLQMVSRFYAENKANNEWQNRCSRILERFDMPRSKKIKEFSRGMKTQLSLALALAADPDLLILDEPLEGLDPIKRMEMLNLLLEEFTDHPKRSILISSHYLEELERLADRVAFLHQGKLVKEAAMDSLKYDEKVIRVVFQKDPPQELLEMNGVKEVKRESKLGYVITIEHNFNAVYEACAGVPHFVLDIYHRDLTDLFVDLPVQTPRPQPGGSQAQGGQAQKSQPGGSQLQSTEAPTTETPVNTETSVKKRRKPDDN